LGNHCSSIIKYCLGPAVTIYFEREMGEKTWGLLQEGLLPSPARTFFLRLLFQIKIFPNRILRNCRASAFIPFTWGGQGLDTQLRMWQKGAIPAPALGLAPRSSEEQRALLKVLHCCKPDPEGSLYCSFPMPLMRMEELPSARDFPAMGKPQVLFPASRHQRNMN